MDIQMCKGENTATFLKRIFFGGYPAYGVGFLGFAPY